MYKESKSKQLVFLLLIIFLSLSFYITISSEALAMTPKLVHKMTYAFESLKKWMLKLATPAAAVSVAVGLFMKKFSFGDEERLRMSKKIIRGSLVGYALLLTLDLILNAITVLLG